MNMSRPHAGRPLSATFPKQEVAYNSYDRPESIFQNGITAALTYNGAEERVRMAVVDSTGNTPITLLTRYYLGGRYEIDITPSSAGNGGGGSCTATTTERFYLGGDAYSAPMVLVRTGGSGAWSAYNIGRDYLGSITHIITASGTPVAEYSYEPWGRQRNPETLIIYYAGSEPELFLGRGYTGHEYLPWFGLYNMNARLYDPLVCRFLAPDPFVQAPDFTQNFNRYSYCLNNPVKYSDESGEFVLTTMLIIGGLTAAVFGAANLASHAIRKDDLGHGNWAKYFFSGALAGFVVGSLGYVGLSGAVALSNMSGFLGFLGKASIYSTATITGLSVFSTQISIIGGAISHGWSGVANAGKIILGSFYLDENKSFFGQVWEGVSRHTWEFPQQATGYTVSSIRNCLADRVDYWGGSVFITNHTDNSKGVTLGNFININNEEDPAIMSSYASFDAYMLSHQPVVDDYYIHEYGHSVQSKIWGPLYLPIPGLFSFGSAITNTYSQHNQYWTEVWANTYSKQYLNTYYDSFSFPSALTVKY